MTGIGRILVSLIVLTAAGCQGAPDERLESLVMEKLDSENGYSTSTNFFPLRSGEYRIMLVLRIKSRADSGTSVGELQSFSLTGTFEVIDADNSPISRGSIEKMLTERTGQAVLARFQLDSNQILVAKGFQIMLVNGTDQLSRYFSDVTVHVQFQPEFGFFD